MAATTAEHSPRLPPRWFIRTFWVVHRALVRLTGGRVGLWRATEKRWGTMWIRTVGRRSGRPRNAVIAYLEDGPNVTAMAMNGWAPPEPAWWLNLQAHPETTLILPDGPRRVRARAAAGAERARLWARWGAIDKGLDGYAARRPHETAVVVFEPR
ncbi:MAG: nitroreductase family deazaflavin-dependent oxidoreductase [Thermoleophilia bacterium]|jgi:deazaflavin-dependent oxidoreductase (nitroreductase family)|nr:nitroreductase family deazaflavin-dependent oxidoreductase [Thermoleophilia bacterium]